MERRKQGSKQREYQHKQKRCCQGHACLLATVRGCTWLQVQRAACGAALFFRGSHSLDIQKVCGQDHFEKSRLVNLDKLCIPSSDRLRLLRVVVLWWVVLVVCAVLNHLAEDGGVDLSTIQASVAKGLSVSLDVLVCVRVRACALRLCTCRACQRSRKHGRGGV